MARKEKAVETEVVMSETPKYLSSEELVFFKLGALKAENRKLNVAVMERDVALAQLRSELEKERAEVIRHRLIIMKQEHGDVHRKYLDELKAITDKFGVGPNDRFGYDPESGEVSVTPKA